MAKQGLNYYNIETDRYQDRKIKRLKHNCGCNGLAVYDYVLCEVYRDRGCVLEWDDDTAFDVADYFGLKVNQVKEIVRYCGAVGLFDAELLSRGIVTSVAIQKRYLEMSARAKRTNVEIPAEYLLISENSGKIGKIREETAKIREETPINKSKINNNNISLCNARTRAHESERQRFLEIFFFEKNVVNPLDELERFINHYEANGWCRNNSDIPVKDKRALARSWKPQSSAQRFPADFVKWLNLVYAEAMQSEPDKAQEIMTIERVEQGADGKMYVYTTQAVYDLIERNMVHSELIKGGLFYRIKD